MSPLTQGLNYRSACDMLKVTLLSLNGGNRPIDRLPWCPSQVKALCELRTATLHSYNGSLRFSDFFQPIPGGYSTNRF